MKKLITLSAVAVAGATLGVGYAFAWPDDELQPKPEIKVEAVEVRVPALGPDVQVIDDKVETPKQVLKIEVSDDEQIEIIGDAQAGVLAVAAQKGAAPSSPSEKLANDLEREAQEMEERGEKEAAQIQRKVAGRLRQALSQKILYKGKIDEAGKGLGILVEKQPDKYTPVKVLEKSPIKNPEKVPEKIPEKMQVKIHAHPHGPEIGAYAEKLKDRIVALQKTDDKAARQKIEAEIRELQAAIQKLGAQHKHEISIQHIELKDGKPVFEKHILSGKSGDGIAFMGGTGLGVGPVVAHELRVIAMGLEREGHKEQAQAIRDHAARIEKQAAEAQVKRAEAAVAMAIAKQRAEVAERSQPQRVESHVRSIEGPAGEIHRHEGVGRLPGQEEHHRGGPEVHHRSPMHEGHHPHMAPPGPGDIQDLLHQLRREIGQLREEVRDLRGALGPPHMGRVLGMPRMGMMPGMPGMPGMMGKMPGKQVEGDAEHHPKLDPKPVIKSRKKLEVKEGDDDAEERKPNPKDVRKTLTKPVDGEDKAKPDEKGEERKVKVYREDEKPKVRDDDDDQKGKNRKEKDDDDGDGDDRKSKDGDDKEDGDRKSKDRDDDDERQSKEKDDKDEQEDDDAAQSDSAFFFHLGLTR